MIINLICTVFNGVTVGSNTDILVQTETGQFDLFMTKNKICLKHT